MYASGEPGGSTPAKGRVFAVLLRGVNVNGITVTSAALRASVLSIDGLSAARTLLASGNVMVRTTVSASDLKPAIEAVLRRDLGYDAWVVVVSPALLADALDNVPWADDDEQQTYLTFGTPEAIDILCDEAAGLDTTWRRCSPQVLGWRVAKGTSTTDPLARVLARPRFKALVTTRNLRTVTKLAAAQPD